MTGTGAELPPTQYLIMEVLAARARLGEMYWTFPNRVRPPADRLAEAGLVVLRTSAAAGCFEARFTGKGLVEGLGAGYVSPIAQAEETGRAAGLRAGLAATAVELNAVQEELLALRDRASAQRGDGRSAGRAIALEQAASMVGTAAKRLVDRSPPGAAP